MKITAEQMKRLQTLYSQYVRHTLAPSGRADRIAWASAVLKREVASFGDISAVEASHLIDTLQRVLNVKHAKKRPSKARARDAGTHGRRGASRVAETLVSQEDLARINSAIERLGWDKVRFDAWLRSPSSPLRGSNAQVRTLSDANRVWWALKKMLVRAGLWEERAS